MAGFDHGGADGGGAAVLPHDGPVQRLAAGAVEGDHGLALVGHADGGHGVGGLGQPGADLGQRGPDGVPDLSGVVLDPPGAGVVLGELAVGQVDHLGLLVDHQGPHTRRPGVDRHHTTHGTGTLPGGFLAGGGDVWVPGAQTIASAL